MQHAMYEDGKGQSGFMMKLGDENTGAFLSRSNKQSYVNIIFN
jgi:hypothetical protein